MRHDGLKLSRPHRRWFYASFAVLFLSGALWLFVHALNARAAEDATSLAEPWLLKIHGAAAMIVLVVIGSLVPLHIRRGWRARLNRGSGAVMVAIVALLALTGYGLYYAGGESLRDLVRYTHDAVGLAVPLAIVWHIYRGRKAR